MGIVKGVVAGNFDVIHPGYIDLFNTAKEHCDILYVLLHTDPSIERPHKIKPVLSVDERVSMLLTLEPIDYTIPYTYESELYELLKSGDWDVRFMGDDYKGKEFTGSDLDIKIVYCNRDHGWSTTKYKTLIAESL